MFAESQSGFRQATAHPRRTKVDWAREVAELLDTRYAQTPTNPTGLRKPEHTYKRGVLRSVRFRDSP